MQVIAGKSVPHVVHDTVNVLSYTEWGGKVH